MTSSAVVQGFDVSVWFGGVHALDGVSFLAPGGSIIGIVGSNGSGKSTLLNCISGLQQVTSGRIDINGVNTIRLAPWRVARMGVARAFQTPRLPWSLPVDAAAAFISGLCASADDMWASFDACGVRKRALLCSELPFADKRV